MEPAYFAIYLLCINIQRERCNMSQLLKVRRYGYEPYTGKHKTSRTRLTCSYCLQQIPNDEIKEHIINIHRGGSDLNPKRRTPKILKRGGGIRSGKAKDTKKKSTTARVEKSSSDTTTPKGNKRDQELESSKIVAPLRCGYCRMLISHGSLEIHQKRYCKMRKSRR